MSAILVAGDFRGSVSPLLNADALFRALPARLRLLMPVVSVIGGLVVFGWSRRLYGTWAGCLSLTLWVFCPNILARRAADHVRLSGATALGVRLLTSLALSKAPNGRWAAAAGVCSWFAQLSKFTHARALCVWPFLWVVRLGLIFSESGWPAHGRAQIRARRRSFRGD